MARNEVVRIPLRTAPSSHRRLRERLLLGLPGAATALTRVVFRQRPGSRLRRLAIPQMCRLGLEAANRRDYEAALVTFDPGCETIPPAELIGLGFDPAYRGYPARLRFQEQWEDHLGAFINDAVEVVDAGQRIALLVRLKGTGERSGAAFDREGAYVFTASDGRLIREELFFSHAEALDAAGISRSRG